MSTESEREPSQEIESLVRKRNAAGLDAYLDTLTPGEVARAISRMDADDQANLLTLLEPHDAADLLEELSDTQGAELIDDLSAQHAAAIVNKMKSDHRVDLLAELNWGEAEAILEQMHPREAHEARRLLQFPEDTAGGIMVTEFISYSQNLRVSDVLEDLRKNTERYSDYGVQYAYVTSERGTLVGVVPLRNLLLCPGHMPLTAAMIGNPIYVEADTPLDELEQIFDRYPFVAAPVTDSEGRMLGVVRRAHAEEALGARADRALMRFGGIIGGDELRSMALFPRAFHRLAWLSFNLVLSLTGATVIGAFEDTIKAFVAVAMVLPIVANLSGCSGNQAVAVSIRELALNLIQPRDYLLVLFKEVQVGLINGLILGGALAVIATVWKGSVGLGLVAALALALNTIIALSLGGMIPLLFRKLHIDPALASPPLVTSFSDMCAFLLVLSLATHFLVP